MSNHFEKRSQLIAIGFFAMALFVFPFVGKQLNAHCWVFGPLLVVVGLGFYFGRGPRRLALPGGGDLSARQGWGIMVIQIMAFVLFMLMNRDLLTYSLHAGWGDEPSYVNFDFSSLTSALGNHRPLGLPVIIKLYQVFFKDFNAWPYVQMSCFILSIVFLYWSFRKFGFSVIVSLVFVSFLLWDPATYKEFLNVQSEAMAAVFLNLSIGAFFWALRSWNLRTAFVLSGCVLALCLVRPNFAFVPVLMPLWAYGTGLIRRGGFATDTAKRAAGIALAALLPLFIFCSFRFVVIGQFGIASMSGGYLSGHAVHYLNEYTVPELSPQIRPLAEEILRRKRLLTAPNNLSPFDWIELLPESKKIEMQALAFGPDLITAWTVAIKQLRGVEPFSDPKHNIDPMQYGLPLSGFHAQYYNHETDRLLMTLSKEVLRQEWKRYGQWLIGALGYAVTLFTDSRALWLTCLGLLGILKLLYLLSNDDLDPVRLTQWHQDAGILAMIGLSIFLLGLLPVVVFNFPFMRLLNSIGIYLVPALVCVAIPPFWLKQAKPDA